MPERLSFFRDLAARLFSGRIANPVEVPVLILPDTGNVSSNDVRSQLRRTPDAEYQRLIRLYIEDRISKNPQLLADDPIFNGVKKGQVIVVINGTRDLYSEAVLEILSTLVAENYDNRKERELRKFGYSLDQREQKDSGDRKERRKVRKVGQSRDGQEQRLVIEQEDNPQPIRRSIVIEKVNSSIKLNGELNDERLLKEIRRSRSEIPEDEILEIVRILQTEPVLALMASNMKRVKHGPFEGYHEFRRGKTGRILFHIDDNDTLHIRMGPHDHIYATRKITKDPAGKL